MSIASEGPEESADQGGDNGGRRASRRPPGCIVKSAVIAIAALAGGTYLITSSRFGPGGRAGGIVLIFIGAIVSLPALAILFGMGVSWYFARKLRGALGDIAGAGREMVRRNKAIWAEERHEYRDATEEDYAEADRAWYDERTRELEAAGFRNLGDVVNVTLERSSNVRPVIRRMISSDGTTVVGLFHLTFPGKNGRPAREFRNIDVESEFSDGTYLITNNAAESDLTTNPPGIRRTRHSASTPVSELLRIHESEKVSLLAGQEGLSCTVMSNADDVMEMQHREQAAKVAFRKGIGYVDPEEVRRIAARKAPDDKERQDAAALSAEIARQEAIEEERERQGD